MKRPRRPSILIECNKNHFGRITKLNRLAKSVNARMDTSALNHKPHHIVEILHRETGHKTICSSEKSRKLHPKMFKGVRVGVVILLICRMMSGLKQFGLMSLLLSWV